MQRKDLLIKRMNDLGYHLSKRIHTIALMGLGSIGVERDRLDDYSDLDFFLIVENGFKNQYIDHLDWLEETYPLGYQFKNSKDGYKIMFKDGIYGEFAVFDLCEVPNLYQSEGKIIWQRADYDTSLLTQSKGPKPTIYKKDMNFALNEALTNIYVGLCRVRRGEILSGYRFIETFAFNNILSILHHYEEKKAIFEDDYNIERRFEVHYPLFSDTLKNFLQGYERLEKSAFHIFMFLKKNMDVPKVLEDEILRLINEIEATKI